MTTRASIYFTGHVQGVGFRYTVLQSAKGFEVTGFVRNLDDGRVELLAEGEPAEIDAFVSDIRERMSGYVRHVIRNDATAPREYRGFTIR